MKIALLTVLIFFESPDYCLSLYHFNIQYVPGGLNGYFVEGLGLNFPELELTSEEVEDRIVKESFEPLLDVYLSHPSWGADIELQGYMVEVLAQRFPDVLDKLRTLVDRGQIDLVSIHYSDQLLLAYPVEDMEWSLEITRRVFEDNGLSLSPVVFAQEGQAGEGMFRFLGANGYRIMILPYGLFNFLHKDESTKPIYSLDDLFVLVGGADVSEEISVHWIYFDDGELAMTGGLNPYFGTLFVKNEEAINKFVSEIETLERDGCRVVKITDYVREVTSHISPHELPPIIDGTWHPESSLNMFKWMGGKGDLPFKVEVERDNEVLTLNYEASLTLRSLEILVEERKRYDLLEEIENLKKTLLLAEVSDATGWNPWRTEVNYSLEKASYILTRSLQVIDEISDGAVNVSLKERKSGVSRWSPSLKSDKFPIPYTIQVSGFNYRVREERYEDIDGAYRLEVDFIPAGGSKKIEISFPLFEKKVEYTPALSNEMVSYDSQKFSFKGIGLSLYNGIIGLGNGYYLIKHTREVHLAGIIDFENGKVRFVDETGDEPDKFVFTLYRGDAVKALELAERINTMPVMSFGEEGCGCYYGGSLFNTSGIIIVWVLLYFIVRRKRNVS